MQRLTTVLLATLIMAGCDGTFHSRSFYSDACGKEVVGYTHTVVLYTDSKLAVIPISKIRPDTEWRFYLAPKLLRKADTGDRYEDNVVTITGKRAQDSWINTAGEGGGAITGTFQADRILTGCVNIPTNTPDGTEYYYIVEVDEIGVLDPRGRVKR